MNIELNADDGNICAPDPILKAYCLCCAAMLCYILPPTIAINETSPIYKNISPIITNQFVFMMRISILLDLTRLDYHRGLDSGMERNRADNI